MGAREQFRLDVLTRFLAGKLTRRSGEQLLGVSTDTFRRYLRAYEERGLLSLKHGNTGREPVNKTPRSLKLVVTELWRQKYFDFNIIHFQEKLRDEEELEVPRETLRRWAHEFKLLKRPHRRRKRAYHQRPRMAQAGLLLQMDGSQHLWFGKEKTVLIAVIDDATSDIYHAEFFKSEDTLNCMDVLKSVIERKGIFHGLYVDRAGIYGGTKRQDFSQLKRACEELGINVFFAQTPQAKGRVERLFRTLQDRLIPEMRLRNIESIKMANWYLWQEFLPKVFKEKFTVQAENPAPAFQEVREMIDLREIFCVKEQRIINNDHTIRYDNQIYALKLPFKQSIAHQAVEIRHYPDQSFQAFWREHRVTLSPVRNYSRVNSQ